MKSVTLDNVETEYLYGKKGRQSQIMIDSLASVYYGYNKGNLSSITTGGIESSGSLMNYSMTYDSFGRTLSVAVGNETLASYTYEAKTGNLLTMTYGNGFALRYYYDKLGRTTSVYQDEMCRFEYEYDGAGNLYKLTDRFTSTVYLYGYDSVGNLISQEQYGWTNNAFLQGQYYTYNSYGDLASSTLQIAGMDPVRYICTYDYENKAENQLAKTLLTKWSVDNDHNLRYEYDGLNRIKKETYSVTGEADDATQPYVKSYGYLSHGTNGTTTLVNSVTYSGYASRTYSYTYDNLGNITAVYNGSTLEASYTYDDLGQLTRENNKLANKTYVYTYDDRGNITSRKIYAYTTGTLGTVQSTDSYGYYQQYDTEMWGDVLKIYNGTTFSYDSIGNPLTYYNGSSYTFSWMQGRKLVSGTKGSTSFSYSYNSDGLRTSKTVGNQVYTYYWNGTQLVAMTISKSGTVTVTMCFYYNADGAPLYFTYNGTEYFYVTNLQGDVTGIANGSGIVGYYEYDAWGKILTYNGISSTDYSAITYNPLRYRGYIYDNETGFYYLQTRYYDPAIRRFINADDIDYLGASGTFLSYNLYAYCENNPVSLSDPNGHFVWEAVFISEALKLAVTCIASAVIITAAPPVVKSAKKGISDLIDEISELVDELTIDAVVDTDIVELPKQEPIYYGAHVYGGKSWEKTTGPMTMDQATIWIYMTAASNKYGRAAAWGVYTYEEVDAYSLAVRIRNGKLVQHLDSGCYPHYHINGYNFGKYKHFHIWYGEIIS